MVAARDRASFEPVSHSHDLRARRLEPRLAHDDSTCKLVGLSDYGRFRPGRRLQHFVPGEPATGGLDSLHLVPAHRAQLLAGTFGWIHLWLLSLHAQPDTWWAPGSGDGVVRPAGRLSRASLLRGHIQAHYIRGAHGINAAHPISHFGRSPGYYDRL